MNHPGTLLRAVGLLILSNVFMTFTWKADRKNLAGKPHRLCAALTGAAQDHPESHPADGFRAIRDFLHERADPARLPVGGVVYHGRGIFHFQKLLRRSRDLPTWYADPESLTRHAAMNTGPS
jgi:hypothetical protein